MWDSIKRCLEDLALAEQVNEKKLSALADFMEKYPIETWQWQTITIGKTIISREDEVTARYKALLAILNPIPEEILSWLSWLKNKPGFEKDSFNIQNQFFKYIEKNHQDIHRQLKSKINHCIIKLLLLYKSKQSINDEAKDLIAYLLINPNSTWNYYFNKYATNLTIPLAVKYKEFDGSLTFLSKDTDNEDEFYNDVLKTLEDWVSSRKSQKNRFFPEYKSFATLFAELANYTLSAFFYQISEGKVPSDIASQIHARIIPINIDNRESGLNENKKIFSLGGYSIILE